MEKYLINTTKIILILVIYIAFHACDSAKKEQGLSFFSSEYKKVNPAFELLTFNDIKPEGWIKTEMKQDITSGFTSCLDSLLPKIFNDDIFSKNRRTHNERTKDVGSIEAKGEAWEVETQWWNSETQGNWWDGYIRTALLLDDSLAIHKVKSYIRHILDSQDKDGYLGIYAPDMRFHHVDENGELWAQTVLFRGLLGYYEATKDSTVLNAVIKAMSLTIQSYHNDKLSPFDSKNDWSGVTHGLMITDICEMLYHITHDKKYPDFAVLMYHEFSKYPLGNDDIQYLKIMNDSIPFRKHGAHTYEHLRSLLFAYYSTGFTELNKAYRKAFQKLEPHLLPSGAGIGFESINGAIANPDSTASEFCTMLELRNSYISAFQKTGDIIFADKAELLTFNGIHAACFDNGKALSYLNLDNCYKIDGSDSHGNENRRYKYSPTHEDVAACCAPNYGRVNPYYVSGMWMKAPDGLVAAFYGPSVVTTQINGSDISINEKTNYPFSDTIVFEILSDLSNELKIYFRIPGWSVHTSIEANGVSCDSITGYKILSKKWKKGDQIRMKFNEDITIKTAYDKSVYIQKGPVVYAYKIPAVEKIIKKYNLPGFFDYHFNALISDHASLCLDCSYKLNSVQLTANKINPWKNPPIAVRAHIVRNKNSEVVDLIPMGCTILRKTTFTCNK